MSINVQKNTYTVTAILKDGGTLDLTPATIQMSWQDPAEEVAQRATLRLAQLKLAQGYLNSLLPLCTMIIITANGAEVFRGKVWEWEYSSSNSREIGLMCYDDYAYAANSTIFSYFPPGKSTKDIISTICGEAGIPLDYKWQSATHDKTVSRGSDTIADQVADALEAARLKVGGHPVATFANGTLTIQEEGYNSDVYAFKATDSAMNTRERMTMEGLVTQVAIYGAESEDDRRQVEAVVPGKLEYGTLQKVILRSSSSSLSDAKSEAQNILKQRGEPRRTISARVPDIPPVRKGWKVHMEAGSLLGDYIVLGVTHDATTRTMSLELRRL